MNAIKTSGYRTAATTVCRLEALVDRIEADPGAFIDIRDFEERREAMDFSRLEAALPGGLILDDLVGILRLALLTECATESYAAAIRERADTFDASWLARFVERVWVPDELTHHAPYKHMLMRLGFAESDLDREIKETQEKEFVHFGGDSPVHVTAFGMVQEYLTDHWHGLIAGLLQRSAPHAAYMALSIKRRETQHTVWYRDMTALQIEAEPSHVAFVAQELARFRMPGNSLVPELQRRAEDWLPLMGADMDRVMKDMLRLLHQVLGSPKLLGQMLVQLAAEKGLRIGPLSARNVEAAANRLGGPGFGLVGEAALEMGGLDYLYGTKSGVRRALVPMDERLAGTIRGLLRTWLADEMARRVGALTPAFAADRSEGAAPA